MLVAVCSTRAVGTIEEFIIYNYIYITYVDLRLCLIFFSTNMFKCYILEPNNVYKGDTRHLFSTGTKCLAVYSIV